VAGRCPDVHIFKNGSTAVHTAVHDDCAIRLLLELVTAEGETDDLLALLACGEYSGESPGGGRKYM
jgi:hypothetical protein